MRHHRSRRRTGRRLVLLVLALALTGAVGRAPRPGSGLGQERRFVPVDVDTLWMAGGTLEDTTLLIPAAQAVGDSVVYLLDRGGPRIAAFRARDGALLWLRGRQGGGPTEFANPTAIDVGPDGTILVADASNARISRLTPGGRWLPSLPLYEMPYVQGMCAAANGSLVLALLTDSLPILTLDADGVPVGRAPLPWPDLEGAPELATQTLLVPSPDHRDCVVGLYLGRGFALHRGGRFGAPVPYIESFELPGVRVQAQGNALVTEVAEPQVALGGGAITDTSIVFAFRGLTADQGRILDVYDRSGAYRYSHRLDGIVLGLAWGNGIYFVNGSKDGIPALFALRIRRRGR